MNDYKVLGQYFCFIIFAIVMFCYYFMGNNYKLYLFWQPIIDNFIFLILLIFMLVHSTNWIWICKRILYSLIFILLVNSYAQLFGMELTEYSNFYIVPLLSIIYTTTVLSICKTIHSLYKYYKEWKN